MRLSSTSESWLTNALASIDFMRAKFCSMICG